MSSHLNKTNNKFYKYPGDEIWVLLTLISKNISRLTKNDIRRHRCNKDFCASWRCKKQSGRWRGWIKYNNSFKIVHIHLDTCQKIFTMIFARGWYDKSKSWSFIIYLFIIYTAQMSKLTTRIDHFSVANVCFIHSTNNAYLIKK